MGIEKALVEVGELVAKTALGKVAAHAAERLAEEVFGAKTFHALENISKMVAAPELPNMMKPAYKVLVDGRSPFLSGHDIELANQTVQPFSLPQKTLNGWVPGDWVDHSPDPRMADIVQRVAAIEQTGLDATSVHGAGIYITDDPTQWVTPSLWASRPRLAIPKVYEVQIGDSASIERWNAQIVEKENPKTDDFAAGRIRLLREIEDGPLSSRAILRTDSKKLSEHLDMVSKDGRSNTALGKILLEQRNWVNAALGRS